MADIELNIINFVTRLKLIEPGGLTLGHRTFLKSLYGLELDAAELEFYCRATGRKTYVAREHREIAAIDRSARWQNPTGCSNRRLRSEPRSQTAAR